MTNTLLSTPTDSPAATGAPGIDVDGVSHDISGTTTLHPMSFSVRPGEVLAIAGGSGAGKSTLLDSLAGVIAPTGGSVAVDRGATFAYVPQDDIIHRELPLRRTLEHAAALRMPAGTSAADRSAAVEATLYRVGLQDRAGVVVDSLSGGQRKRASIAVEMLTSPQLFFLDEPTSGLDPASAASLMADLREIAAGGATIVLTTHAPSDLARCDRIVFLAPGGHLAFIGTADEAKAYFDVDDLADAYEILALFPPTTWSAGIAHHEGVVSVWAPGQADARTENPGFVRQVAALARRNIDLIRGNRLTAAILAGSPVMVVGMKALLFQSGTFNAGQPSVQPAIQTLFWVAFGSFFFGVTYGLLQVVGEFEIVKRERRVGLRMDAYVASKLLVLAPMLALVNTVMLGVLQSLGRMPAVSFGEWLTLFAVLELLSVAALATGLLASAAVHNSSQATLALPMLCFPQVLFAGAVVPVSEMGLVGTGMSSILGTRWGFEALGRVLDLGPSVAAEVGTVGYEPSFSGSPVVGITVLAVIIVVMSAGTIGVLRRRT